MKFWSRSLVAAVLVLAAFPALALDKTVGVILLTKTHQFTRDLADEILDHAPDFGIRLDVQYAEFDLEKQSRIIDDFIARKVDAVLLTIGRAHV